MIRKYWRDYKLYGELKNSFPSSIFEPGIVIKGPVAHLKLGNNVEIQSNVTFHLGGMKWCEYLGYLEIGDNSCISPNTIIYAAGPGGVKIGKNFDCGPGVGIYASSSGIEHPKEHQFAKIEIGDDVTLFANVVVLPGVKIGDGAVIGAGAVVTRDIPPFVLAYGVPAKAVRLRPEDV